MRSHVAVTFASGITGVAFMFYSGFTGQGYTESGKVILARDFSRWRSLDFIKTGMTTLMQTHISPMRLFLIACIAITGFAGAPVLAKDCESNTLAIVQCASERYQAADKELNKIYSERLKSLKDGQKQKLIEAQRAWLKYRDASLAFVIETYKDAGSYGSIVVGEYQATLVEKRVKEIKYLLSSPADPPVSW